MTEKEQNLVVEGLVAVSKSCTITHTTLFLKGTKQLAKIQLKHNGKCDWAFYIPAQQGSTVPRQCNVLDISGLPMDTTFY